MIVFVFNSDCKNSPFLIFCKPNLSLFHLFFKVMWISRLVSKNSSENHFEIGWFCTIHLAGNNSISCLRFPPLSRMMPLGWLPRLLPWNFFPTQPRNSGIFVTARLTMKSKSFIDFFGALLCCNNI